MDLVRCVVTGQLPIVCAQTGLDIGHGEEVFLDPTQTNIDALVASHLVKVEPGAKAKA